MLKFLKKTSRYLVLGGVWGILINAIPCEKQVLKPLRKDPIYIYQGHIDRAEITAELEYDITLACPVIRGSIYYDNLPEESFKVKGSCSYLFCNDDYEREEYAKYGDMIHLSLLRKNKIMAQAHLCQQSEYMTWLEGWLYSAHKTYKITLKLREIREE